MRRVSYRSVSVTLGLLCLGLGVAAQDSQANDSLVLSDNPPPVAAERLSASVATDSRALQLGKDDVSVRSALQRWCRSNGWQLVWQADVDFLVETEISYGADIKEALPALFDHLSVIGPRLHAVMFMQNKVLLVRRLR